MDASDRELIDAYLKGSQEAFAALVGRHLDLVYSAARRQTRSSALAEEVAQTVFLKLSQHAAGLQPDTTLPAWLYVATRHAAIDLLRQESRRRAREQAASEIHAMHTAPSVWNQVEPLLDEAMAALPSADRDVLVHRYFADKSLRDVGAALGISDDAAQKRVSRALDQLRSLLAKCGVTVTVAGLATDLSAHAIEAAPAALGPAISVAGFLTATSTGAVVLETTRAIAMTTLQKATLATAAILVLSAGVYQVRVVVQQERRITALEQEATRLNELEAASRRARDGRMLRMAAAPALPPAAEPVAAGEADPDSAVIELYTARIASLRAALAADPRHEIPELQFLTNTDWMSVASERAVDNEPALRASLGRLRTVAKSKLAGQFTLALRAYVAANDGSAPASARELLPFLGPGQPPATFEPILDRYTIAWRGSLAGMPARTDVLVETESSLADREFDLQLRIQGFPDAKSPGGFNFGINSRPGPKAVVPQRTSPP
jgi:RNA polymerase sigma factor (sigma-70 family)